MADNPNTSSPQVAELPKSTIDWKITQGSTVSVIGIDSFHPNEDYSKIEYRLYRHYYSGSSTLGTYSSLTDAKQAENNYVASLESDTKAERLPNKHETPATRVEKEKPTDVHDKKEHHKKTEDHTKRADAKAPQEEGKKPEEPKTTPEKTPDGRTDAKKSENETDNQEYSGGTFFEDVEHWIPSLFKPAQIGIASLKNDLLENSQDGGSPILGALAASGLDLLDTAMGMTQGVPLGILDLRNLGEGTEEALIALEEGGSAADVLRGLKKDASRALTIAGYIVPEGAVIKAINRALTGSDIIDSLSQGDYKGASTALALAALHEKAKSKAKGEKGKSKTNDKGNESMKSGSQEAWLSKPISGNQKLLKLKDEILDAHSNDSRKIPLPRGIKLTLKELGNLSSHLGVELAVVSERTIKGRERFIIVGDVDSVSVGGFLNSGNTKRVVAHTHPGLNTNPSRADISIINSRAAISLENHNHGVRAGQTSSIIVDESGNAQKFRAMFSGNEYSKLDSYW